MKILLNFPDKTLEGRLEQLLDGSEQSNAFINDDLITALNNVGGLNIRSFEIRDFIAAYATGDVDTVIKIVTDGLGLETFIEFANNEILLPDKCAG